MPENRHYFVAAKIPDEAKKFLHNWVKKEVRLPFQRWVHSEDYHITLAFLGTVEKNLLQDFAEGLKRLLENEESYPLTFRQLGTFGSKIHPRIFWADVFQSNFLLQLQKKVYNYCIDSGFELDKKPFRPHITIARTWNSQEPFKPGHLKKIRGENGKPYAFVCREIVIYETHLKQTPKYKEWMTYPLRDPEQKGI